MKPALDTQARAPDQRFRFAVVLGITVAVWLNAAMLMPWARFTWPLMSVVCVGVVTAFLQRRLDAISDYVFLVFIFLAISVGYLLDFEGHSILLFESISLLLATAGLLVMSIPERRVLKAFAVFAVFLSGFMMAKYAELSLESSQTIQVLWFSLVALVGVLTKSLRERRLHARLAYLELMVMRDSLTGLFNQQSAYKKIEDSFAIATAASLPVALAMIDLDGFKEVNDSLGHDVGDRLLRDVATCIAKGADGTNDMAARMGGDEFLVCWNGVGEAEGQRRADALRVQIRQLHVNDDAKRELIDASIGIAVRPPESAELAAQVVRRADQAMYAVKRARARISENG